MKYLTPQDVLVLHAYIIEETGGSHGVRDFGLLLSVMARPKSAFGGKHMYINMFEKAGAYLEAFVRYHVFIDGNKRIAIASAVRFLHINKFEFIASNKEVEKFILKVVVGRLSVSEIARWLKKYSRDIK